MDRDHPSPEPGTATESGSSRRCPYCRTTFERDDPILTCASCNAVHHGECWEENGGCAVWGCESRPAPGQPSSSSESESESDPLPHVKVRTVIEPDDVDPPLGASQPRDNRRTEPERLEALDRVDRFLVAGIRSGDFSASRQALRRLAAKLEIPGRSSMNKDELFGEILTATSGDSSGAAELVAGMNRRELDQVAALLEIAGRSGMSGPKLIEAVNRAMSESSLAWGSDPSSSRAPLPPLGASQPRDNRRTEPERLEALDRVDRFLVAGIRSGDFSASRQALRRLAAKLEIPGRSSMNKDELFGEILTATSGDSSGAAELVAGMNRRELDQVAASLEIAGRSGMTRSQLINAVRRGIAESSLTWKHHSPSPDDARSRHSGGVLDGESGGTAFFAVAVFGILLGLIVAFVILGIQGKLW